jgi:hypothetical protein
MELRSISNVAPAGSSVGALYQKLYIQSKSAPEDGRICRRNMLGWFKKVNKRKICRIFLVVYVVDLGKNDLFLEIHGDQERRLWTKCSVL